MLLSTGKTCFCNVTLKEIMWMSHVQQTMHFLLKKRKKRATYQPSDAATRFVVWGRIWRPYRQDNIIFCCLPKRIWWFILMIHTTVFWPAILKVWLDLCTKPLGKGLGKIMVKRGQTSPPKRFCATVTRSHCLCSGSAPNHPEKSAKENVN